jgi:hypothetical protein
MPALETASTWMCPAAQQQARHESSSSSSSSSQHGPMMGTKLCAAAAAAAAAAQYCCGQHQHSPCLDLCSCLHAVETAETWTCRAAQQQTSHTHSAAAVVWVSASCRYYIDRAACRSAGRRGVLCEIHNMLWAPVTRGKDDWQGTPHTYCQCDEHVCSCG